MIAFWIVVVLVGLFAIGVVGALCEKYRSVYHVFWLALIGGLYFMKEDKMSAAVIAAFYFGSMYLLKIWQELSNELTSKIVDALNATLTKKPT